MSTILFANKTSFTDQELLEGLLANSRAATEFLYQQCYPKVAAQLRRMGAGQEDIRDMFQEGMVVLWKNARKGAYQVQTNTRMSTYLVQVCKWQWSDRLKQARTKKEIPLQQQDDPKTSSSFLDQWMKKEELDRFRSLFAQLGERCQDMLRRFYFQKESMRDIAAAFSITDATARTEKYRCMQRLKQKFNPQES